MNKKTKQHRVQVKHILDETRKQIQPNQNTQMDAIVQKVRNREFTIKTLGQEIANNFGVHVLIEVVKQLQQKMKQK